jgi:HEAT repeat protein/cyclophilin family peptidyl-prolyl cis-trans isomerase
VRLRCYHRHMNEAQGLGLKAYGRRCLSLKPLAWSLFIFTSACASAPPAPTPSAAVKPPVITWEEKLGWILRLEDQRLIRDPNPPPQVVLAPATKGRPAIVAPPPPSDLIRLLNDEEGRTRRRAALALGRVGLPEAVPALQKALGDPEFEVRQMAAFALGLIGDVSARPALLTALKDSEAIVQGRAAEALGAIGDKSDAPAIAGMVQTWLQGGALNAVAADDLAFPLAPPVEAVRLGLYALVRLGSYDAIASCVVNPNGAPVSAWWPIAYALGRAGDARATPTLTVLLQTPGRFTAAFAARGLGTLKAQNAAPALRDIVDKRQRDPAIVIEAIRALAGLRDLRSRPVFEKIVAEPTTDPTLRLEAANALAAMHDPESLDFIIDLMSDPAPAIRGAAIRALAAIDSETFLTTLSGLDPDRDWTVRTSLADALAMLPGEQGQARLVSMLQDRDPRVVPAVLRALVAAKAPDAERILVNQLKADDFVVRQTAASGLASLKATGAASALVEAYRATDGDSTYVARAAILDALNTIDAAAARPLLQAALQDKDWAVRIRAAMLLGGQGVADTATAIRPAPVRPLDDAARQSLVAPQFSPHAFIQTDRGAIEIELAISDAPLTVANFIELAHKGFFNGVAIHRVVPDFVVQDGDPRGDGEGGPGYTIRDEFNELPYLRGTVGMALDWKDTGGSQFFITHSPQPHLDARYTAFGRVVNGIEVVDRIQPWDVIRSVQIWDGTTLR